MSWGDKLRRLAEKFTSLEQNSLPLLASAGIAVGLAVVRRSPYRRLYSQVMTGTFSALSFLVIPSPFNLGFIMAGNYMLFAGVQAKEEDDYAMNMFELSMLTYTHLVGIAAYVVL